MKRRLEDALVGFVLLFFALCFLFTQGNAQTEHCKPTGILNITNCYQDSPFDPPKVIAERNRQACIAALVEDNRAANELLTAKQSAQTLAATAKQAYSAKKTAQKKIARYCKP